MRIQDHLVKFEIIQYYETTIPKKMGAPAPASLASIIMFMVQLQYYFSFRDLQLLFEVTGGCSFVVLWHDYPPN